MMSPKLFVKISLNRSKRLLAITSTHTEERIIFIPKWEDIVRFAPSSNYGKCIKTTLRQTKNTSKFTQFIFCFLWKTSDNYFLPNSPVLFNSHPLKTSQTFYLKNNVKYNRSTSNHLI